MQVKQTSTATSKGHGKKTDGAAGPGANASTRTSSETQAHDLPFLHTLRLSPALSQCSCHRCLADRCRNARREITLGSLSADSEQQPEQVPVNEAVSQVHTLLREAAPL